MAYSDYGGYAYRNGARVEDRSDCTITPGGDTYGTPGSYPGFALLAAGVPHSEVVKRSEWPSGHAVLGDGPIYVVLYKQSTLMIYRGPERLDERSLEIAPRSESMREYVGADGKTNSYFENDWYVDNNVPCAFDVDGCKITVFWTHEDNYYQYVRMEQPDGTVWHGWSGYGVGAGLEDGDHGFSTPEREDQILSLWPDAIK